MKWNNSDLTPPAEHFIKIFSGSFPGKDLFLGFRVKVMPNIKSKQDSISCSSVPKTKC